MSMVTQFAPPAPSAPVHLGSPLLAPPAPSGGAWGDASPQTPAKKRGWRIGVWVWVILASVSGRRWLDRQTCWLDRQTRWLDKTWAASYQQGRWLPRCVYGGGLGGGISPGSPGGALDRRPQPRGQSAMGGGGERRFLQGGGRGERRFLQGSGRGERGRLVTHLVLVALLLVAWLSVVGSARAAAASTVRISGTVANGATHKPVADEPVALDEARGGATVTVARTRSDTRGRFTFTVPSLVGDGYAVVATYKGVPYGAPVDARQPSRPLTVSVYDTTPSDSVLIAPLVQIGMARTSQGLQVAEEWTVVNPTTATDVGRDPATGRGVAFFPVPPGASNVSIVAGATTLAAPATVERGAVVMNTVIRPATGRNAASFHQVKFAFTLPYGSDHPTLRIPTRYLIGSLEVFALGGVKIEAPGFTSATLDIGNNRIAGWRQQAVPPNTTVSVGVDGAPAPLTPVGPPPFPYASVLILVGGGFALLLFLALGGRAPVPATAAGGAAEGTVPEGSRRLHRERERLVTAIAELDLQYARGRVPPSRYERRRAQEKSRLLDVARKLGG